VCASLREREGEKGRMRVAEVAHKVQVSRETFQEDKVTNRYPTDKKEIKENHSFS